MMPDTNNLSAPPDGSTTTESNAFTSEASPSSVSTAETSNSSPTTSPAGYTSTTTAERYSSPATPRSSVSSEVDRAIEGAFYVSERVMPTLGALGSSALLENIERPFHSIVDDGRKVAERIKLDDDYANLGASVMSEVAMQSDKESQDGTTTAVTIADAILREALRQGRRGTAVKRELESILPVILERIDSQTVPLSDGDIKRIATTSSNSEEIGSMFEAIFKDVGNDGLIELENSYTNETRYEVTEGTRLLAGYIGQYPTTEPGKAVYTNPLILITDSEIKDMKSFDKVLGRIASENPSVAVILCKGLDASIADAMAQLHLSGSLKTLPVIVPALFDSWIYEDAALLTGATVIHSFGKYFDVKQLGTCEKITVTKDETRLFGTKDISEHVAALKEQSLQDENLKTRIGWLSTKAAVIKAGARSAVELSHKRAKLIDAAGACKLAIEGGFVAGGGIALLNASNGLGGLLEEALKAPARRIASNAGYELPAVGGDMGFDVLKGEVVHMKDAGILDPAKVVKNSVTAAVSIAGTLLSVGSVIPFSNRDKKAAEVAMRNIPYAR